MTIDRGQFWSELGDEHAAGLEEHGFGRVKRVQALRYFTWQWTAGRLRQSEQARALLRATSPATWARAALTPNSMARASWSPAAWSRADWYAYVVACRLLWEVALRQGDSAVLDLEEPELGSPFPVKWRGRLVSQDLANSALEVATIREALGQTEPRHIVEIGAGYGRTGHVLLSMFPRAAYTVIDIPPALEISRWYLTSLFPNHDLRFLHADDAGALSPFDLAVSISSLQEMSRSDVRRYMALLSERGWPGAVAYLKQWVRWRNPVDRIEQTIDDYILPGWSRVIARRAPVQTRFAELAWRRPGDIPR